MRRKNKSPERTRVLVNASRLSPGGRFSAGETAPLFRVLVHAYRGRGPVHIVQCSNYTLMSTIIKCGLWTPGWTFRDGKDLTVCGPVAYNYVLALPASMRAGLEMIDLRLARDVTDPHEAIKRIRPWVEAQAVML